MKRGKKGIAQIDWVVSFVIFFLYLAWFFVIIRPIATPPSSTDSQLSSVRENLLNDASWSVDTVPIFILTNLTLQEEPLIVPFPFSWEARHIGFRDNTDFYLSDGKIFFIANISNVSKNIFWIAHSAENYTSANTSRGLIANSQTVTLDSAEFSTGFADSVPQKIIHSGKVRMSRFNISHDSSPVITSDYSAEVFDKTFIIARYASKTDLFNASFYVFATSPRIYGFISSNTYQAHNITITATLHNYTNYHATENQRGLITLNSTCTFFSSAYIDAYDETDGISFFTQEAANGSICGSGGATILALTLPLKNETSFIIHVHKGTYRNTTKYSHSKKESVGVNEQVTGISLRLVEDINNTDYSGLKRNWSYSPEKNFAFFLFNRSEDIVLGYQPVAPPLTSNVYVSRSFVNTLDKNGLKKKHTLLVRGW